MNLMTAYSGKFFKKICQYHECNRQMYEKWASISRGSVEEVFPIDHFKIDDDNYNCKMRQHNVRGEAVKNITDLFECASLAKGFFERYLVRVVQLVNLSTQCLTVNELKRVKRCIEKAHDKYHSRLPGPEVSWLFDVLSAVIICETEAQILAVVDALWAGEISVRVLRLLILL